MPAWYSTACQNNTIFLGVFVALIILCWLTHVLCNAPLGAQMIPDSQVRTKVGSLSYSTGIFLFLIAMLVLFACANSAAAGPMN